MAGADFVRGEFRLYRATATIHLGAIQKDVFEDDTFEYDGQTMKYGGETYSLPSLRGGVRAGWFVPAEDTDSYYTSKPAGVLVRPATSAGSKRGEAMVVETATEEEAVVGSLEGHQGRRRDSESSRRHTRKAAAPPPVEAKPSQPSAPTGSSKADRVAALRAELEELEAGGGEPAEVKQVKQATVVKPNRPLTVEEADEINRRILEAERTKQVPPKKELPPEEDTATRGGFQVLQASDQEGVPVGKYQFSGSAGAPGYAGRVGTTDITKVTAAAVDASLRPVAETPHRQVVVENPTTQISSEGNTDVGEKLEGWATGDVSEAKSGDQLTALLGDTAAAAGADPSNPLGWDTGGQWRARVKMAVDKYGQDPAAMRQILAVETPAVRKHIGIALKKLHGK